MSAVTSGAPFPRARSGKRSDRPQKWGNPGVYFVALLFIAVSLAPVVYIVLGGFRTNSQITVSPAGLPSPWVFSNYVGVLKTVTFWGEFANSTIVATASTLGIVLLGLMVSYVIDRYDFKLKGAMYSLFAAGLMFPLSVETCRAMHMMPFALQQSSSQYSQATALVLAFTSLSMLPALAFFAVFQRRIVGGLTGAVKG